jgi:hypothetical protein
MIQSLVFPWIGEDKMLPVDLTVILDFVIMVSICLLFLAEWELFQLCGAIPVITP